MKLLRSIIEAALVLACMTALGLLAIYLVALMGVGMGECNQALQWCH